MKNQEIYQKITTMILDELKSGVAPWRVPYKASQPYLGGHRSFTTEKPYSGINAIITYLVAQKKEFNSCDWGTFKQWKAKGRVISKNQKGTPILFYQTIEKENQAGEKESFPCARYFCIFNENQLERDEDGFITETFATPNLKAENVFENSPLKDILILKGNPAYRKSTDQIFMPLKYEFKTQNSYYSTLFHEMAHATGHELRLNRESLKKTEVFGDHSYSKEELVAEMTSAFLQGVTGIESEIGQSASYCNSWLKRLESDSSFLVQAASSAQKAADYIQVRN